MTYQWLFKTLKQREQQMAKTLNDADNQSTTSDTSSASNKMKTHSQDEDEFDASVPDTEQETDTIKYFCSKCVFIFRKLKFTKKNVIEAIQIYER